MTRIAVCALILAGAACSRQTTVVGRDGGRDVAARRDANAADRKLDAAGTDAKHDAAGVDARHDAARLDAAPTCPAPITDQCTTDAGDPCRRTWDEVLATSPRCDRIMGPGDTNVQEFRLTCGAYNVDMFGHLDWSHLYYYDSATGQVVAEYRNAFGGNVVDCLAGPPDGIAACSLTGSYVCHQDAGADAHD